MGSNTYVLIIYKLLIIIDHRGHVTWLHDTENG